MKQQNTDKIDSNLTDVIQVSNPRWKDKYDNKCRHMLFNLKILHYVISRVISMGKILSYLHRYHDYSTGRIILYLYGMYYYID